MTDTRKIRFEVDDSHVKSAFDRIKDAAKDLSRDMMRESFPGDKSGDPRSSFSLLESKMRSIERQNVLDKERLRGEAFARYRSIMADPNATYAQLSQAKPNLTANLRNIADQDKENRIQTQVLREILDALKTTAREEIVFDKEKVKQRVAEFEKGEIKNLTPEERATIEQQRILLQRMGEKPEEEKKGGIATWMQVAGGVLVAETVKSLWSTIKEVPMSLVTAKDDEQMIASAMRGIPFIGGFLGAGQERHIETQETRDKIYNKLRATTGRGDALNLSAILETEDILKDKNVLEKEQNRAAILKSRGIDPKDQAWEDASNKTAKAFGNVGLFIARQFQSTKGHEDIYTRSYLESTEARRKSIEEETKKRDALSDATLDRELANNEKKLQSAEETAKMMGEIWSYEKAGYDQNEFMPIALSIAKASGTGANLPQRTRDFIDMMKGRGLDEGMLTGLTGLQRYDTGGTSVIGNVSQMENIFKTAGIDRTRLGESLNIVKSMGEGQIGRGLESTNMVKNAQIKAAFESLGGTFAFTPETLVSMDASMSQTKGDFDEGLSYKIYANMMAAKGLTPTYLGYQKWKEKGMTGEGRLEGEYQIAKDMFGDSQYTELYLKNRLGLKSYTQAGIAAGLNPDAFAGITGEGSDEYINNMRGGAGGYTSEREQSQARITNDFAKSAAAGMGQAAKEVGAAIARKIRLANIPMIGEQIARFFESSFDIVE